MINKRVILIYSLWCVVTFFVYAGLYLAKVKRDTLRNRSDISKVTFHQAFREPSTLAASTRSNIRREFIQMKFGPVFIFGVAAGNTSETAFWDIFKLYGGIDRSLYRKSHFYCCLAYQEGPSVYHKKLFPYKIRSFDVSSSIWSIHVTCSNIRHTERVVPVGVAISVDRYSCNESDVTYVSPYYPLRESQTKLAIGTKTAYGNISAELIIEWMEAYKYLGVDRVITYFIDTLNEKALKVLQYYASTGILDLYFYEPAASEKYERNFYTNVNQRWNDQQIVVDDTFERMSGYQYFGIIDHDEFLIPARDWSIKEMMAYLYRYYPNATGLHFKSQYFYLSWGKGNNESDMILGTYTHRRGSLPQLDNTKSLYIPSRVRTGGVDTHVIKTSAENKMYLASQDFGTMYHYRTCRQRSYTECMTQFERVTDTTVATWSEIFRRNVEMVREKVFGSKTAVV